MKNKVCLLAALTLATAIQVAANVPPAVAEQLKEYTGVKVYGKLDPATSGKLYVLNFTQLYVNYNGGVDFQLRSEGVLLTPENKNILYSAGAVPECRYRSGSRPELEQIVKAITACCTNERDKALMIMRFCRDLYKKKPYPVEWEKYIFGGTEEELILKGEILCEALARLQVAMCEIANIPARIVMHIGGGHVTSEVFADGKWGYIDPRMGIYFLDKNNRLASVQELIDNPQIIDNQSDAVKADTVAYAQWSERAAACKEQYFSGHDLNLFEYYSLADKNKYRYNQLKRPQANALGLREINREYVKTIKLWFDSHKK